MLLDHLPVFKSKSWKSSGFVNKVSRQTDSSNKTMYRIWYYCYYFLESKQTSFWKYFSFRDFFFFYLEPKNFILPLVHILKFRKYQSKILVVKLSPPPTNNNSIENLTIDYKKTFFQSLLSSSFNGFFCLWELNHRSRAERKLSREINKTKQFVCYPKKEWERKIDFFFGNKSDNHAELR